MKTTIDQRYIEDEKRSRRTGLIGSFISFGILLVALFYLGMYYQIPPPEEEGVALILGTPDGGMMAEFAQLPTFSPSSPSNPTPDESLTQDEEEAPSINQDPAKPNPVTSNTDAKPDQPSTQPTRTFDAKGRTGGSGDGGNPGNQGDPLGGDHGDPYGSGGSGNTGNGLGSRNATQKPIGNSNCVQKGFIMVKIEVDPQGRVVKAEYHAAGSTISNIDCRREALAYAKTWRFQPDPNAGGNVVDILPVKFE